MDKSDKSIVGRCVMLAEVLAGALFLFVFVMELVNVVLRHGFNSGIPQSTEGGAFALAVITFLGIAPAFLADEHVKLQVFQGMFRDNIRAVLVAAAEVATFVTLVWLAYLGVLNAVKFYSLPFSPPSMPWLPYWIPMSAVPLGMALGAIALLRRWYVSFRARSGREKEGPLAPNVD